MKEIAKHYVETIPAVAKAAAGVETTWLSDRRKNRDSQKPDAVKKQQIEDARRRLERFEKYIQEAFPETRDSKGIIESPLCEIESMKGFLNETFGASIEGRLYLKMDSNLPISGSVKARGGIYEVLQYAEHLAMEAGLLKEDDDYSTLVGAEFRGFFSQYTIQVGSTGNLGLSIGIISAKLGFRVIAHMSVDAKEWKKELLRSKGVDVIEYESDYSVAVEEGRANSDKDPKSYFVDDENSLNLFLGYAVAGKRVKMQLQDMNIKIDELHPLFVYIPCGIGGAPGGITYGLKEEFGDNVHCFFVEPTQACCMFLGMATGEHDKVSVSDFDISGKTDADGLAVGRSSKFVGRLMEEKLSGISTIEDRKLYVLMRGLLETENIFIEPSACASFGTLIRSEELQEYINENGLHNMMGQATHIAWATGGSMVPEETVREYLGRYKD